MIVAHFFKPKKILMKNNLFIASILFNIFMLSIWIKYNQTNLVIAYDFGSSELVEDQAFKQKIIFGKAINQHTLYDELDVELALQDLAELAIELQDTETGIIINALLYAKNIGELEGLQDAVEIFMYSTRKRISKQS